MIANAANKISKITLLVIILKMRNLLESTIISFVYIADKIVISRKYT